MIYVNQSKLVKTFLKKDGSILFFSLDAEVDNVFEFPFEFFFTQQTLQFLKDKTVEFVCESLTIFTKRI